MDLSFLVLDLKTRLAQETAEKEKALLKVQQLEEETDAAALLQETSEQAVQILEEQLAEARLKLLSAASGECEESVRGMINGFKHLEMQEASLTADKERLEAELSQSVSKCDKLAAELEEALADNEKLRTDLAESRHEALKADNHFSRLWAQYKGQQQNMQKQFEEVGKRYELEKESSKKLQISVMDRESDIVGLEQVVADLENQAINERNRASKLEEESKNMHTEYQKLQSMFIQESSCGYMAQTLPQIYRLLRTVSFGDRQDGGGDCRQVENMIDQCISDIEPLVRSASMSSPDDMDIQGRNDIPPRRDYAHGVRRTSSHTYPGVSRIARGPM